MTPENRKALIQCLLIGNIQKAKAIQSGTMQEGAMIWMYDDGFYCIESMGLQLNEDEYKEYCKRIGGHVKHVVFISAESMTDEQIEYYKAHKTLP